MYGRSAAKGTNWTTLAAMSAFHVLAVVALFHLSLGAVTVAALASAGAA